MRFRYIDADGPAETEFRDVHFVRGVWTEVKSVETAEKLRRLPGFEPEDTIEGEYTVVQEIPKLEKPKRQRRKSRK